MLATALTPAITCAAATATTAMGTCAWGEGIGAQVHLQIHPAVRLLV